MKAVKLISLLALLAALAYLALKKTGTTISSSSDPAESSPQTVSNTLARQLVQERLDIVMSGVTGNLEFMTQLKISNTRKAINYLLYRQEIFPYNLSTVSRINLTEQENLIMSDPDKVAQINIKVQDGEYPSFEFGVMTTAAYRLAYYDFYQTKEFRIL